MSGRAFWGIFGGGNEQHPRFSLAELQRLHSVVLRNQVVTDANRDVVVEALRSISELVIWGDQHESENSIVEYFLTQNMLGHFTRILLQRSNRRGNVAMQVLQTLSILVQNVRNEQTVFYLFSNNHINEIVTMRFDFDDDEVLGYYVNLLKTISLKLNEVTVQFFFQASMIPGQPPSFPLYTEAVKFINHRDGMVRTAVKTLTLNVFGIPLPVVQQFVTSRPASHYFSELATYVAEQCQVLDRLLSAWDVTNPQSPAQVEACLAEVEDLLSYCNDVLATGVEPLRGMLLECLWQAFVGPVLFWPLIQETVAAQHIATLTLAQSPGSGGGGPGTRHRAAGTGGSSHSSPEPGGTGRHSPTPSPGAAPPPAVQRGTVGPLCSLYVFERLFQAITDQPLLTLLVSALLGGTAAAGPPPSSSSTSGGSAVRGSPAGARPADMQPDSPWRIPAHLLVRLQYTPAAYRQAVLGMLRGSDPQVAAATVRVLASLLQSKMVDEGLLEVAGLLPRRRKKQRQLLAALTGDETTRSSPEPEEVAGPTVRRPDVEPLPNGVHGSGPSSSSPVRVKLVVGEDDRVTVRLVHWAQAVQHGSTGEPPPPCLLLHASQHHRPASPAPPPQACSSGCGESSFQEITGALMQLLGTDLLPPVSLGVVGWLLHCLLAVSNKGSAEVSPTQQQALAAAADRLRGRLHQQLQGPWCDALSPLVAAEWARTRQVILRSGAGSLHFAVYTWMQAVLVQELQWQLSGRAAREAAPALPANDAAVAAKQAYLTVQSLVAVVQLQLALEEGDIPQLPPTPLVLDADLRSQQIREQTQISLSARMHCMVAFSRGQERQVYFGVGGLPPHITAEATDLSQLKPAALQLIAASSPVVLLADAGSRPDTGLVLSTAPLMGASAAIDPGHPKWLHIAVRPPLRGLLKVVQASHPGNVLLNLHKHLISGHWTLAFPDADRAASAASHVEVWLHRMRVVYCQLLAPLEGPCEQLTV